MRYILFTMLSIVMFLGYSCSGSQKHIVKNDLLEYDTISIPIDYPYVSFYYTSSLYAKNDTVLWAGYNHLTHSIDFVDITHQRPMGSLNLDDEGPNAIFKNQIGSFVFNDSLIVFKDFSNNLKFYSRMDGVICRKVTLFPSDEDWSSTYIGVLPGQFNNGFSMRLCGDMIVLPVFSKKESRMDDVIATSVNVRNFLVEHLNIHYPEVMREDLGRYGSLTYPCLTISSDRMVYNFPYSSRVYSYLLDENKIETLSLDSRMTGNLSASKPKMEKRDARRNFDYENMSLRFGEAYYDEKSDSYIRVHFDEKDNPFDVEKSYLMAYNLKTQQVTEYSLPSCFSTRYYVSNGFIYFLLKNNSDDYLHFASINLEMLFL